MRTQNGEEEGRKLPTGRVVDMRMAARPNCLSPAASRTVNHCDKYTRARTKETAQASPRIPQGPCCHWTTAHDKIGSVGCMRRLQGAPAYTVADLKRGRVLCALSGPQRGFDTSRPGRLERAASSQRSIQAQSRTLVLLRPK